MKTHRRRPAPPDRQNLDGEPVNRSLPFLCPTLTPLYHTSILATLTPEQQLRYNQLTAQSFNEVILFFEQAFARVLRNLLAHRSFLSPHWQNALGNFLQDERNHRGMWEALNRSSEPERYPPPPRRQIPLVRFPAWLRGLLHALATFPHYFPCLLWIMWTLEEFSLEIATRCLRASETIDPRYLQAHRRHQQDEARHVAVDRALSLELNASLPRWCWPINRWLFGLFLEYFWRRPVRSARRVTKALAKEFPELRLRRTECHRQLAALRHHPAYQQMMIEPARAAMSLAGIHWKPNAGSAPAHRLSAAAAPAGGRFPKS